MPLYTFNLCKADGISVTFEFHDLMDDSQAVAVVGELLERHASCEHVEVWEDERAVASRRRGQRTSRSTGRA